MRKTPQDRRGSRSVMRAPWLLAMAMLFVVAGCRDRDPATTVETPIAPAPVADDADQDVPPATAPVTDAGAKPEAQTPQRGTPGYSGFGSARFGGSAEDVRAAWGESMIGGPGDPAGCYYLYPQPKDETGHRVAFMIENGRFARLDVDAEGQPAPGGGAVGMTIDEVRKLYPGIAEYPHKYVEGGKTLRHKDGSGSVVVFEVNAEGRVTAWHLGVPPQVDYVEGCG